MLLVHVVPPSFLAVSGSLLTVQVSPGGEKVGGDAERRRRLRHGLSIPTASLVLLLTPQHA